MRSRILTVALALSLLATVFVAFPTKAGYEYTGSVVTTDDEGNPTYVYIEGERIYVKVSVYEHGVLSAEEIRVEVRPVDAAGVRFFETVADDPAIGWYNSTEAAVVRSLPTDWYGFSQEQLFYVIAYERLTMTELDRTTVLVKETGFTVEPDERWIYGYGDVGYYPGQTLYINMVTTITTEMFYVQIVNETGGTVMNWTGQIAPSGYWRATWLIPADLPSGEYTIKVRDSTTHLPEAGWYSYQFDVKAYVFWAMARDRNVYLPGETALIDYYSVDVATLGASVGVSVTYCAHWLNMTGGDQWLNGSLMGSSGTQEFAIPATDVATWNLIDITYWANQSGRSEVAHVSLDFGLLRAEAAVYSYWYRAGEAVYISVTARINTIPLPGCMVDVKVKQNGTEIAAYGVTGLMTDSDGKVAYSFRLVADAALGRYSVEATVSKLGSSTIAGDSFEVYEYGYLDVRFDKDYYLSGDTMTLTISGVWLYQPVTLSTVFYMIYLDSGLMTMGNTSSSTVTAVLPAEYAGNVYAYVTGYYGENTLAGYDQSVVNRPGITVVVDKDTFKPGDKLTFTWHVVGDISTGTINYELWSWNFLLEASSPAFAKTGTITYDVPMTAPERGYALWIVLVTPSGLISDASAESYLAQEGQLNVWAEKSKYADGSYKPGQTVKIQYSINTYVSAPLPAYVLVVWCDYDPTVMTFLVTSANGVVEFKLPADLPTGMVDIDVEAWDPVRDVELSSDTTSVTVNNQLSAWDRSVGGMALSDFLIILLLVVMIIMLIVMPFVKGRQPKTEAPVVEEPLPPPAEPPKT